MKIETANEHMRTTYGLTHYVDLDGDFWLGIHANGILSFEHGPLTLLQTTPEEIKATIDALQKVSEQLPEACAKRATHMGSQTP